MINRITTRPGAGLVTETTVIDTASVLPKEEPVVSPSMDLSSYDGSLGVWRGSALFGSSPLALRQSDETLRRNLSEYVHAIPYSEAGNLQKSFPALWRALRDEDNLNKHHLRVGVISPEQVMHKNVFYFGDRQASRVIVSLTGAPITAGYLVPFFNRLRAELDDDGTAFLLLPSCAAYEAEVVLHHLAQLNRRLESVGFFTHSGGSLTLHQIQKDGYLPEMTDTFCALGWVYRHDFQTFDPQEYVPEPIENYRLTKKQYDNDWNWHVKRGLCSIGRYYFPEALWGDPATREILMSVFIDATRLRRVSGGLGELQNWQKARGSYVRQVTHLAHKPGMKFLIFAGTDDGAVSEKHSREALAKLSGVPLSVIPRDEPWQNENLGWYPLVGAKHLPMLERSDEMAKGYAVFLRKR